MFLKPLLMLCILVVTFSAKAQSVLLQEIPHEKKHVLEDQKQNLSSEQEQEPSLEHFLNKEVQNCSQTVCFAMIPFPAAYSQRSKGNLQIVGVTTGEKKLLLIRFYFN